MRKTMWQAALFLGLAVPTVAGVAGCSGAEAGKPAQTADKTTEVQTAQAPVRAGAEGPERFVQRFDKNKNGLVELTELPERMQKWLGKADTNGDGALSKEELTAHFQQMGQEMFHRADKNGDGALEASEVGDRHWEHLKVADANNDGKVTQAEIEAARASGKLRPFQHDGPPGDGSRFDGHHRFSPEAMYQKLDKNGDGVVEVSELDGLPDGMRARVAEADADKDGKITLDELKAHAEQMRKERRERFERGAPEAPPPAPAE